MQYQILAKKDRIKCSRGFTLLEPFTKTEPFFDPSPTISDQCGISSASGNVNADLQSDVIMGCFEDDADRSDQGSVVIFLVD